MAPACGTGGASVWVTLDPPRHIARFSRIPVRVNGQDTTAYVNDALPFFEKGEVPAFGDPPRPARKVELIVGLVVEIP